MHDKLLSLDRVYAQSDEHGTAQTHLPKMMRSAELFRLLLTAQAKAVHQILRESHQHM
jgi:hypothetical protein